ncbi:MULTISPECIES: GABA permease [unclassified Pseudomonas]|uniref:GABA permease n=1 Tax=Pseudomonas TaxID=286 RepID=UPI000D017C6A|nr:MULTISPECIES: GABA permease [unclassified Pseudomonas]PRN02797.1 GABA permease [Pseudomonas sp. LLC-1]PYG77976.1 GABA permease [Pseudomonas sp. RV120224-01c]PYG81576.1 GABA permease [Pseudomonas sp. RV120224-01b]
MSNTSLAPGLKQRHVTMLSIAGVIGAGLFVFSGHAIAKAGPAVILAYIFTGALVVLVMRMLGEMAVASPDTGSFSTYADRAIGPWAGFSIGWLYWWFWVLAIPLEAIAAANIVHTWVPAIDTWITALAMIVLLTCSNFFSVARYGEFEFWFGLIKIVAIIAFIALCAAALMGLLPNREVSGIGQLMAQHGGFAPNGLSAVIGAMLTTMFSFIGAEVVTIAAAESKNPARQITRATNSVVWRICVFYLLSILMILSVVPWNDPRLPEVGSFQRALEIMNIPNANLVIDIVVLLAVASCMNSQVYTASRMLYSLAKRGDAPRLYKYTTNANVPLAAVAGSTVIGIVATFINYFAPENVFKFLLSTSGAVALLVYLVIAVSQLCLRKKLMAAGKLPAFRMWLFPWLTWAVILFISGALIGMFFIPAYRSEITATGLLAVMIICLGLIHQRRTHATNAQNHEQRAALSER